MNNLDALPIDEIFIPLTMLPDDAGRISTLAGDDGGDRVFAFWGNQTGIAYDPTVVPASDLPQTPEDFATFWTENSGRFGFNYQNGGAGPSFFLSTLRVIGDIDYSDADIDDAKLEAASRGFDFFNSYADDYIITASNADSIVRISDGELWMAPAWEDHLAGLQKRGEVRSDIAFYVPEMGMFGGSNGVAIPTNAAHPAAAAVFLNWLTSAETQSALNAQFGTAPMHAEADNSAALVPPDGRANSTPWVLAPLRTEIENGFVDNVILER